MSKISTINWTNTLFLILTPLVGVIGTALLCTFSSISWHTWVLAGSMLILGGISITAGYHRLFSHRTYQAAWPIRLFFVLFGSAVFEGSVLEWSTDHRNHHRYTDTKQDPYNIKQGFWHAHIGWLLSLDQSKRDFSNVEDLQESLMLRLQNRHFIALASLMGFFLPMAIASLWGEPLAGLIVAGALRITVAHHSTFCINSLCHILGKQPYSDKTSARDNWLSALATFGEGYHNYHHQFPLDYRNGVRLHQFDPGKWLIYTFKKLGLAKNLHRIPEYRIIQSRMEMYNQSTHDKPQQAILQQLHEAIIKISSTIKEYEKNYAESKCQEYRNKLKQAKSELKNLFRSWQQAAQSQTV
jgi:stearoyl-CoA desaturase (Delta-9 desaturase)